MILCAVGVALAQGVFTAIAQQNSIAFVMFTMAKGGCLPKFMAKMNKRTNSPLNAVLFIIGLSIVLTLIFQFSGIDMNTVVKISKRKGAKAVFMHQHKPTNPTNHTNAIMLSVGTVALIVGAVFIVIGIIYYLVLTKVLHRQINLG